MTSLQTGINTTKHLTKNINYFNKLINPSLQSMYLIPVSEKEVIKIVAALPAKESAGFDNISLKVIKLVIPTIVKPLCLIINKSFILGKFPVWLKTAKITPIFKSGDKNDLANYRPISVISVLSSFSKIFEKCMHSRLMSYLNTNNILNPSQHGFRAQHNTTTTIIDSLNYVTKMNSKKLISLLLFSDISKTFDSLSHSILLDKLHYYGIRGVVHSWFASYLSNRSHYVQLCNNKSTFAKLTTGIAQGSTLGPILFLIYVNDIFSIYDNSKIVLFADDTCVTVAASDINSLIQLCHNVFHACSTWFSDKRLALNVQKTNFMIIGNVPKSIYASLPFNDNIVNRVYSVKYLGFMLDYKLCWDQHINYIFGKCSKGLGMIKILSTNFMFIISIMLLFTHMFRMALNYMVQQG